MVQILWQRRPRDPNVVEYRRYYLFISGACVLFSFVLFATSLLYAVLETVLVSLILAFAGTWGIANYFLIRHIIEPDGLRYQSFFGKQGKLYWASVTHVRYSPLGGWLRIDGAGGEYDRIDVHFSTSVSELGEAVLQNLPRHVIDPATLELLE